MLNTKKLLALFMFFVFITASLPAQVSYGTTKDEFPVIKFELEQKETFDFDDVIEINATMENNDGDVYQIYLDFVNENGEIENIYLRNSEENHRLFSIDKPVGFSMKDGNYTLQRIYSIAWSGGEFDYIIDDTDTEYEALSFSVQKNIPENFFDHTVTINKTEFKVDDVIEVTIKLPNIPFKMDSMAAMTSYEGENHSYGTYTDNYNNLNYNEKDKSYTFTRSVSLSDRSGNYAISDIGLIMFDEIVTLKNDAANNEVEADLSHLVYSIEDTLGGYIPDVTVKSLKKNVTGGEFIEVEMSIDENDTVTDQAVISYSRDRGEQSSSVTLERIAKDKLYGKMFVHRYTSEGIYIPMIVTLMNKGKAFADIFHSESDDSYGYMDLSAAEFTISDALDLDGIEISVVSEKKTYSQDEDIILSLDYTIPEVEYFNYTYNNIVLKNIDLEEGPDNELNVWAGWDATEKAFIIDGPYGEIKPGRYVATNMWLSTDHTGYDSFEIVYTDDVIFTILDPLAASLKDLDETLDKEEALSLKEQIDSLEDTKENKEVTEKYYETLQTIYKVEKVIENKIVQNKPNFSVNLENLKAINIVEALDEDVKAIEIQLETKIMNKDEVLKFSDNLEANKSIVGLYDLSLMKTIERFDGESVSSKILNDDIKNMLTLILPVPEAYLSHEALTVIHITDTGEIEELQTEIVSIDGVKYLQFQTNHFSVYGIIAQEEVLEEDIIVDSETDNTDAIDDSNNNNEIIDESEESPEVGDAETSDESDKNIDSPEKETNDSATEDESANNKEVERTEDTVSTEKFPETGDTSTYMFTVLGLIIMFSGVYILQMKESKKII